MESNSAFALVTVNPLTSALRSSESHQYVSPEQTRQVLQAHSEGSSLWFQPQVQGARKVEHPFCYKTQMK